jgi:3-oxoacyl-[acyl-carrier-protein] synthase-1
MSDPQAEIYAAGVVCPLGPNFNEVTSAYVEGRRAMKLERNIVGPDGLPPTLAWVYPLTAIRSYAERLARLFTEAYSDCLSQIGSIGAVNSFPAKIVLPSWLEGSEVLNSFQRLIEPRLHEGIGSVTYIHGEHAESLIEIGNACDGVRSGEVEGIFVFCVASDIHATLLDRLTLRGELFSEQNPYGIVPGEAGVCFFISHKQVAESIQPLGRIRTVANSFEAQKPGDLNGSVMGRGLATCLHALEPFIRPDEAPRLLSDLNGIRYRAEEFGFAVASTGKGLGEGIFDPETPALNMGDGGAATGGLLTALALSDPPQRMRQRRKDWANREMPSLALISASSPRGTRAAMIVERTSKTGEYSSWQRQSA